MYLVLCIYFSLFRQKSLFYCHRYFGGWWWRNSTTTFCNPITIRNHKALNEDPELFPQTCLLYINIFGKMENGRNIKIHHHNGNHAVCKNNNISNNNDNQNRLHYYISLYCVIMFVCSVNFFKFSILWVFLFWCCCYLK